MKTKTTAAKRVTWDPDMTDKKLASGLTQTSSPSPDLEPVFEMDPKVGPVQATTKVLDRRPKNRNKVAIRWARKMNNRRLAKIAKKRADDCWASLTDQCLRATLTVPVPAVAKSVPPSSDSIPDNVTDPNPDRDSTIHLDLASMPSSDPFPDLFSNQNPNDEKCLKFSTEEERCQTKNTYERCAESSVIYLDKAVSGEYDLGKPPNKPGGAWKLSTFLMF